MLAIQARHFLVFEFLLQGFIACTSLLLASGLRDTFVVQIVLPAGIDVFFVQHQTMFFTAQRNGFVARKDLMPAVLFVPLGERRGHVHLLDDVPPTHTGVVGAERNLAFLGGIRNNALLSAA